MQLTPTWERIQQAIAQTINLDLSIQRLTSVGGGSINQSYCVQTDQDKYFVKLNSAQRLAMFETEAMGLQELKDDSPIQIPDVICYGTADHQSYLALEWIDLRSSNTQSDRLLGEQLAQLHAIEKPYFGWGVDNFIGSTPQPNDQSASWIEFLTEQRLGYQLQLAAKHGAGRRLIQKGDQLLEQIALFFSDYQPQPALLHGDLWGGNYSMDGSGLPVIFDPACYYGDREADIAMTELFGGFGPGFFDAYQATLRLDDGYRIRKKLYLLYHVLNHFNLFGGGYESQAESLVSDLLSSC